MDAQKKSIITNNKQIKMNNLEKEKQQQKTQKPKSMMLRVINDDNGVVRTFKFKLGNIARISRSYHMKVRHPDTMSFTIELHQKKAFKYEKVASLQVFTRDLPVDQKSCSDLLMENNNMKEIYTIRMLTHLSEKCRCYKCEWVKSPLNEIDIPFLIKSFLGKKELKTIPNLNISSNHNTPLLVAL